MNTQIAIKRQRSLPVLIGMEATGNSQWFIELVEDLGHEIWIGDAAQIRASYVRKQKTDKRDAAHILKLVTQGRFPRLWTRTGSSAICGNWCCIGTSWWRFAAG